MAIKAGVNLANGVAVPAVGAALYTVPGAIDRIVVNSARLVNFSATKTIVNLWVLQSGETTADGFKAVDEYQMAGHETKIISEIIGDSINSGGSIEVDAAVASRISFSANGTEFTS